MKNVVLGITAFVLIGCQSNKLEQGRWDGSLTPMNHPEMDNPLTYDVSYNDDELTIDIAGPDSTVMRTRNPRIKNDTLHFSFEEPEEQVLLTCKMGGNGGNTYAGRCTDKSGKWAYFTMRYTGSGS
jgi:hypothetical protein